MNANDKLEKEVRIAARKPRSVFFVDRDVEVKGIPFSAIEDVGDKIAVIVTPFLQMAVRPVAGGSSAGDAGTDEQIANFDLAGMSAAAPGIRDVAKILVTTGTNISWDEVREYEWLSVVALAIEVLKYNLGPELRNFLSEEVRAIGEVFGIKNVESVTMQSKPSSSDADTADAKSKN